MSDLLDMARRALVSRPVSPASATEEKEDKGEKPPIPTPFSPLSSFSSPATREEITPPTQPEPWDTPTALALMFAADALPEELGVSGTLPAVSAAADRVLTAHLAHDMPELRTAVAAFEVAVRSAARPAASAARPTEHGRYDRQ